MLLQHAFWSSILWSWAGANAAERQANSSCTVLALDPHRSEEHPALYFVKIIFQIVGLLYGIFSPCQMGEVQ